ncbi:MAG: AAA family ATPase [Spirochaetaceae bacterium]|nr:MAG: AAA family ATPase [Spirochaetaceae bacterium]
MPKSIAVAGKGGTGKTTIAALLITQLVLAKRGPVLAIDADPDSNLGDLLGVEPEQSIGDLREEVLDAMKKLPPGMTKANYVEAGLHQIIEEADGFDLITMGRGEGAGCYCALNNMIRKFSDDLTPSYNWVVMDNEAGLEHLSRRTTRNIDALLVVVSDNPLSLRSAEKIQAITDDLDTRIRRKYIVTNMIPDAKMETFKRRLEPFRIPHLIDIPYDSNLEEVIFQGELLKNLNGSPIMKTIQTIIETVGGEDANS